MTTTVRRETTLGNKKNAPTLSSADAPNSPPVLRPTSPPTPKHRNKSFRKLATHELSVVDDTGEEGTTGADLDSVATTSVQETEAGQLPRTPEQQHPSAQRQQWLHRHASNSLQAPGSVPAKLSRQSTPSKSSRFPPPPSTPTAQSSVASKVTIPTQAQLQQTHLLNNDWYDDDGQPSRSCSNDLRRALNLITDERHLLAFDLYRDAKNRVDLIASTNRKPGATQLNKKQTRAGRDHVSTNDGSTEKHQGGILKNMFGTPTRRHHDRDDDSSAATDNRICHTPLGASNIYGTLNETGGDFGVGGPTQSGTIAQPTSAGFVAAGRRHRRLQSSGAGGISVGSLLGNAHPAAAVAAHNSNSKEQHIKKESRLFRLGSFASIQNDKQNDANDPLSGADGGHRHNKSEKTPFFGFSNSTDSRASAETKMTEKVLNEQKDLDHKCIVGKNELNRATNFPDTVNNQRYSTTPNKLESKMPIQKNHGHHHRTQSVENDAISSLQGTENEENSDWVIATEILKQKQEDFDRLEKRAFVFHRAKHNLTIDDDWTLSQTLFGITTYYRRERDGSLSIKLEGELIGVPLFEQLAVLRELDLYCKWAPFCTDSKKLTSLGKLDVVGWFVTGLPSFGISRDACFRAIGCDCMREDGSIIIVGEGLNDKGRGSDKDYVDDESASLHSENREMRTLMSPESNCSSNKVNVTPIKDSRQQFAKSKLSSSQHSSSKFDMSDTEDDNEDVISTYLSRDTALEKIRFPSVPSRYGQGRMTIRSFDGVIDVLSPSIARTRIVANVDPNIAFMPQILIDFCMKKMCGVILSQLQGAARKASNDPIKSPHARRMREDIQFYMNWLLPKFRSYCVELGWEMPPVKAFDVKEEDLDEDEWMAYAQTKKFDSMRGLSAGNLYVDGDESVDASYGGSSIYSMPVIADSRDVGNETQFLEKKYDKKEVTQKLFSRQGIEGAFNPAFQIKEWEKRAEEKRRRKIASARRTAALRMKPVQFTDEMKERLQELKLAKNRTQNSDVPSLDGETSSTSKPQSPSISRDDGSIGSNRRSYPRSLMSRYLYEVRNSGLVDLLTGTHARYHPKRSLPLLIAAMFLIFYSDLGSLNTFAVSTIGFNHNLIRSSVLTELTRSCVAIMLLIVYLLVHWAVITTSLVYAFDSIELPGQTTTSKNSLANARKMYIKAIRELTAYFSTMIVAVAFGRAILISLWRNIYWYGYRSSNFMLGTANQTEDAAWFQPLSGAAATGVLSNDRKAYTIFTWIGWIISIFFGVAFHVLRALANFASVTISFLGRKLLCNAVATFIKRVAYGLFVPIRILLSWLLTRANELADLTDKSVAFSWRAAALDYTKLLMSYTAIFLLVVLAVAQVLLPKLSRKDDKDVTLVNSDKSSASDDASSTAFTTEPRKMTASLTDASQLLDDSSDPPLPPSLDRFTRSHESARDVCNLQDVIYEDENENDLESVAEEVEAVTNGGIQPKTDTARTAAALNKKKKWKKLRGLKKRIMKKASKST